MDRRTGRKRIVILGGGFGGSYLARELTRRSLGLDADVVIIDRNNYFIFYPLLVEAGCGSIEPRHCTVPIREFAPKAELLMAEVAALDTDTQRVHFQLVGDDQCRAIEYDHLVIALGSVTRIMPDDVVSGVREHAFFIKRMSDAVMIRDRAVELLELANAIDDPEERRRLLHFVIVGGNVTGIEVVGELEVFVREASAQYHNISDEDITFTIYEFNQRLLAILPENLSRWATKQLARRGVDIHTGAGVKEVHADHVVDSDGNVVPCSTVIWTAGITPSPVLKQLEGLPLNKFGGLQCQGDYLAVGTDNIWGMGDCASVPGPDGKPMPPLAQIAIRQAPQLAANIAAVEQGRPTTPGGVALQGVLVPLGRHRGVAAIKGIRIHGFFAWAMWRAVYLLKTPRFGRRISVLADWLLNAFFRKDYTQLGMNPASHREMIRSRASCEADEG
ncbi:MAG: NAD(P)/FAD-dependent oxidoreductase [Phycisphaerales bacterium]|nr:NAD(P)/FAD-dependent oxidoreductase [Phycisphaerales bacterium]